MPSVEINDVSLGFGSDAARTMALDGVDLRLDSGALTVISGPSGSGKTSLLSVLGSMLLPDTGSVSVDGTDIARYSAEERTRFRREMIGFVFQSFRLMPALNAEENVRLALEIRNISDRQRALDALETVGLAGKTSLLPNEMSGGEKQRVAVARAIAHRPMLLLADEPTASLDTENGAQVTRLMAELAEDEDRIVVLVTHDPRVLPYAKRVIRMQDGKVLGDGS